MEQRSEDMLTIGQVLARYCRGIDRLDPVLIASVYWEDAYDDHGPFQGGREAFVEWAMREMRARYTVTDHALSQSYYEFRGEQAAVETHFQARNRWSGEHPLGLWILNGRYLDLLERRGGEWRILNRIVMYDSGGMAEAMPLDFQHVEGSRSLDDPSYHIFDLVKPAKAGGVNEQTLLPADPLFQTFRLGRTTLRNRIAMSPMTRSFSPGGVPGPDVPEYYRRRAQGGAGLIITEGTWVPHDAASNNPANPNFFGEAALAAWRQVADAVHAAGGAIMPQLWHVGLMHRIDADDGIQQPPGPHQVGPSGLSGGMGIPLVKVAEPMSLAEIDRVIDAFASAAQSAMRLGFDGVALHAAHGYLIDQFLWHATNRRSDRFAASSADRGRFAAEIVTEIRRRTAPDFPIILRYSQWKLQDFEAVIADTPQQLADILEPIAEAGVDLFDCSQRRFWEPAFPDSDLNLAGWTRRLTGKPSMTVGSIGLNIEFLDSMAGGTAGFASLDRLLEMFNEGQFDMVAIGRALIADPEWPNKVRDGRVEDLLPFSREALASLV